MSRDILDLIDNAIEDAAGPDAMRWAPDAPDAELVAVDSAGYGYLFMATGPDSSWTPLGTVTYDGILTDVSRVFGVPIDLLR